MRAGRRIVFVNPTPFACGKNALLILGLLFFAMQANGARAQGIENRLQSKSPQELVELAQREGDASRGAILFFQATMACSKCHSLGDGKPSPLGPDLASSLASMQVTAIVESILEPSKVIKKGFETANVLTTDGESIVGLLVERTEEKTTLRDTTGQLITLTKAEIEGFSVSPLSIMPAGQVNQLASEQQFYDLLRYLLEVRSGGSQRARQLKPAESLVAVKIPEYESRIDHRGLIQAWDDDSYKRGEAIYRRVCANCHGTKDQPGSLPTALRFAQGKFKNGSDPWAMYQTLTRGFGLMPAQSWMVPLQKYDVVHYIRETFLKEENPSQFKSMDIGYLSTLPKGNTFGPEPNQIESWSAMDYGPNLTHTLEIPGKALNIAYKGISIRLDPGTGGVARGEQWMLFDTDTLRIASAWSLGDDSKENRFIDWRDIQFNGQHAIHPKVIGKVAFSNPNGPGWANPQTGDFRDDLRIQGRDQRRYGPLPKEWGRFHGMYHFADQVVLSYSIGESKILERPSQMDLQDRSLPLIYTRTIKVGPRDRDLIFQVADLESPNASITAIPSSHEHSRALLFREGPSPNAPANESRFSFDGKSYLEIAKGSELDLYRQDFTIAARVKTSQGGTIFAVTEPGPKWVPNGVSLFVRDGRLTLDIGWVGAIASSQKVNDNRWHDIAATWSKASERVTLYVDGAIVGEKKLSAKAPLEKGVARVGFTSPNFPQQSYWVGEIEHVDFFPRILELDERGSPRLRESDRKSMARWRPADLQQGRIIDRSGLGLDAVATVSDPSQEQPKALIVGVLSSNPSTSWLCDEGKLRCKIASGDSPITLTLWTTSVAGNESIEALSQSIEKRVAAHWSAEDHDLDRLIHGGPKRWPQILESRMAQAFEKGPFGVDVLAAPESNPWLAQTRFTGIDFFDDGSLAVCTWDGDVWHVRFSSDSQQLYWQRIASGLYQPLGLKIVRGKIHLTCRDQLAVLHDLNGDGETDFYECLNNDHQVTEHFHEFAMGLQVDSEGHFYYAKSGRHALPAIVPHHGTLLKVSPDGAKTEILATGFRAANGVCINPDGSFLVTDQEGFWNPKNRINWVTLNPTGKPKFYGNMFGYHDITDSSDAAMEPPLCWITNAFDRSPAELLWIDSPRWGPLQHGLLNLSYGYGKAFLVLHEEVQGLKQGGMVELPIPLFPTGVMRGRFHPQDQHLYLCGMFSWAGNATSPGGLFRLRATGAPNPLPIALHAKRYGLLLTFAETLDPASVDSNRIAIQTWSLKRTEKYGSKHFDEKKLNVRSATLSADGKTVRIDVESIQPTWGMEIKYDFQTSSGEIASGTIHNTIHALGD